MARDIVPRYLMPGGVLVDGVLQKTVEFKPLNGKVELDLTEYMSIERFWPNAVSAALVASVDRIGGLRCSLDVIDNLSVGDRNFLMLKLAALLYGDEFWTSVRCPNCDSMFDISIKRSEIPVKSAGPGFPFVCADCGGGRTIRMRIPTGSDQKRIAQSGEKNAVELLVRLCTSDIDGVDPEDNFVETLFDVDLPSIEDALDSVSPDIGSRVETYCPECGTKCFVGIDPYGPVNWVDSDLYQDVHTIATAYHWSEAEILSLSKERRLIYLDLIDHDRGLYR